MFFNYWLEKQNFFLPNYTDVLSDIFHANLPFKTHLSRLAYYFTNAFIGLGIFLLPFSFGVNVSAAKVFDKRFIIINLIIFVAVICKVFLSHKFLPFSGNIFYHLGIGPIILSGVNSDQAHELSVLAKLLWLLLNFIGAFNMCFVIRHANNNSLSMHTSYHKLLVWFFFLLYMLPHCLNYCNDRYLFYIFPFALLLIDTKNPRVKNYIFSGLILMLFAAYTFLTLSDYFRFNQAKWQLANALISQQHINPNKIDGGFEFNGMYTTSLKNYSPQHNGRWWWVDQPNYILSTKKMDNFLVVDSVQTGAVLNDHLKNLFVLKQAP